MILSNGAWALLIQSSLVLLVSCTPHAEVIRSDNPRFQVLRSADVGPASGNFIILDDTIASPAREAIEAYCRISSLDLNVSEEPIERLGGALKVEGGLPVHVVPEAQSSDDTVLIVTREGYAGWVCARYVQGQASQGA